VYTRYEDTELMDAVVIKAAMISRRNKEVADGRHSLVTAGNRYEQEQGADFKAASVFREVDCTVSYIR
nr:hypothetical protein [Tanacetum cinerariifolium]GFA98110.1 hypothetical protein [Tanacetum cinerariifolium]